MAFSIMKNYPRMIMKSPQGGLLDQFTQQVHKKLNINLSLINCQIDGFRFARVRFRVSPQGGLLDQFTQQVHKKLNINLSLPNCQIDGFRFARVRFRVSGLWHS